MTTGLVAIREKFYAEIRVEEFLVIVRAMNVGMAEDTVKFSSQAAMHSSMSRWYFMAFQTIAVSGLGKKPVIG